VEADLGLDLANSKVAFVWVDLALEGLKDERLVAMGITELEWGESPYRSVRDEEARALRGSMRTVT
jgi:hypothetical protein